MKELYGGDAVVRFRFYVTVRHVVYWFNSFSLRAIETLKISYWVLGMVKGFLATIVRIVAMATCSLVSSFTSTSHFTMPFGISFSSFVSCSIFSLHVSCTPIVLPAYTGFMNRHSSKP